MKNDELQTMRLQMSPSLRQDSSLASLFNKAPGPKNGKGKDGHRMRNRDLSSSLHREGRSPSSPVKSKTQFPASAINSPPFSPSRGSMTLMTTPSSRRGSTVSSRRSSVASSRRSSIASSRRTSVESSKRGSVLSYEAILAGLPQAPLAGMEDLDATRRQSSFDLDSSHRTKSSFDQSDRSVPNLRYTHALPQEKTLKKSNSSEDMLTPRLPASLEHLNHSQGLLAAFPGPRSAIGEDDDKAVPLTDSLPITEEDMTVILKARAASDETRVLHIQNIQGETLATWEFSACRTMRVLKDAEGNVCAYVLHSLLNGQNKYKICSYTRMNDEHIRNSHTGMFTWAEVKNVGTFGVKFGMRMRGGSTDKFSTESFAPSLLDWSKRSRGFLVLRNAEAYARMTYLHCAKGLDVPIGADLGLMICYAAIIDEMAENRLR